MWWAAGVAAFAVCGLLIYLCYFAFVRRVYKDHGLEGVQKLAKAIPPPRSIESVAAAVKELAKSRSPDKKTTNDVANSE